MNALFKNADIKPPGSTTFSQVIAGFQASIGEGDAFASGGPLQFTMGSATTDPKYMARFQVDANPQGVPDEVTLKARQDAIEQLKVLMDRELGPKGGERVFTELGLEDATEITGQQLHQLSGAFQSVRNQIRQPMLDLNRPSATKWGNVSQNPGVTTDPSTDLTIEQLLDHPQAEWSIAERGGTGALIVKVGGKGAIIKIEDLDKAEKVGLMSGLMQATLPKGPNGFNVPTGESLGDLTTQGTMVQKLIAKLQQLHQQEQDPVQKRKLEAHIGRLQSQDLKSFGVSKMGFVAGDQLNELPLDDRMALIQTGALAEQLGKATVLCPMMGLNDHVTTTGDTMVNLSNFMIDPSTGKLAPIDFDAVNMAPEGETPFFASPGSTNGLKDLVGFMKDATDSPEQLQQSMRTMVAEQIGNKPVRTPLGHVLKSMVNATGGENLLSPTDVRLMKEELTSPDLRENQALAMMRGTVAGLKYLQENKDALKLAFTNEKQGMKPEEFDEISQAVDGLDIAKMEQQLNTYEQQMVLRRTEGIAFQENVPQPQLQQEDDDLVLDAQQHVQPELDKLARQERKLDRLQTNPNFGDKFKAFFTRGGMDKLKRQAELDIEKTKLQIAAKVSPEAFQALLDHNRTQVGQLRQHRENLRPGAQQYVETKNELRQKNTEMALDQTGLQGLSSGRRQELYQDLPDLRQDLNNQRADYDNFKRAQKDLKQAKKIDAMGEKMKQKSVGDQLGIHSAKHDEGNQQGEHRKL
jgi:hypothetical protein